MWRVVEPISPRCQGFCRSSGKHSLTSLHPLPGSCGAQYSSIIIWCLPICLSYYEELRMGTLLQAARLPTGWHTVGAQRTSGEEQEERGRERKARPVGCRRGLSCSSKAPWDQMPRRWAVSGLILLLPSLPSVTIPGHVFLDTHPCLLPWFLTDFPWPFWSSVATGS